MVADFFSTCLLKGEEGRQNVAGALNSSEGFLPDISVTEELNILKELANKKPDLLQRIKEFIKGLLAKLKGERRFKSLEADLTYLDNYVEKLINSNTTKNTAKSGEVRYKIQKIIDKNGKDYGIGVYLDSEILDNLSEKERIQKVKEYVKSIGGNLFTAFDSNGEQVNIRIAEPNEKFKNKNDKTVPVNKDLTTKYNKNIIKQKSIVLIDELITTAQNVGKEPAKHSHGWLDNNGKNDWDKWTTYIQDKEKTIWEAILHIANTTNDEKILYDISTIKKAERSGKSDANSTNDSIPNSAENVNKIFGFEINKGANVNEDLKHSRSDNIKEFARGDVLIRVGENDYSAQVIIGFTNSQNMVLYDVVDFEKTDFELKRKTPRSAMQNAGSQRNEMSSTNSISTSTEKSNKNFSEDDSKFNDDTRYSSRLMEQIRYKFLIFPIYYGKSRQANYNT